MKQGFQISKYKYYSVLKYYMFVTVNGHNKWTALVFHTATIHSKKKKKKERTGCSGCSSDAWLSRNRCHTMTPSYTTLRLRGIQKKVGTITVPWPLVPLSWNSPDHLVHLFTHAPDGVKFTAFHFISYQAEQFIRGEGKCCSWPYILGSHVPAE